MTRGRQRWRATALSLWNKPDAGQLQARYRPDTGQLRT